MMLNLNVSFEKGKTVTHADHELFCLKISNNLQVIIMVVPIFPASAYSKHHNLANH